MVPGLLHTAVGQLHRGVLSEADGPVEEMFVVVRLEGVKVGWGLNLPEDVSLFS